MKKNHVLRIMRRKRTNMEIIKDIHEFILTSGKKKFFKSDLRDKNIEPGTAADWFRIIEFIQNNFPKIRITEHRKTMIIEIETNTVKNS
ncbi:MAG: hypothetical protein ACFE9L_14715 [Candidatus Hodarchaeota archaeon]